MAHPENGKPFIPSLASDRLRSQYNLVVGIPEESVHKEGLLELAHVDIIG